MSQSQATAVLICILWVHTVGFPSNGIWWVKSVQMGHEELSVCVLAHQGKESPELPSSLAVYH